MTVAEASLGFPILDETWQLATPHEPPPCDGIPGLYNMGSLDRCAASAAPRFHCACETCTSETNAAARENSAATEPWHSGGQRPISPLMNELHAHSPDALAAMATLLRRASGGQAIDVEALQEDLLSLIYAIGQAHDGSEDEIVWLELAAEEPSHAALAEAFSQAADADNPLASGVLSLDLRPELSGRIRKRWLARWMSERRNTEPTLRHIDWEFLQEPDRDEIRQMLRDLAKYHRSFVRRGRLQKTELDTALQGLAEIFLQYSGLPLAEHEVPYSVNSQFIRFAVLALEPAGQYFEVSMQALSRRWERCVKHMRTGLPNDAVETD